VFTFFADKVVPIIEKVVKVVTDLAKTIDLDFSSSLKNAQSVFKPVLDGLRKGVSFVTDAFERNREKLQPLLDLFVVIGKFIKDTLVPILAIGLGEALKVIGFIIGGTIDIIATLVKAIDDIIKRIDSFIQKITNALSKVKEFFAVSNTDFTPASSIASARGLGAQPTVVNNQ
jgi:phage-related protein